MKKNIIIVFTVSVVALIILFVGLWFWGAMATGAKETIVQSKGGASQLSYELARKKVIRSPLMFRLEWGKSGAPQEGYYALEGKSLKEIITQIKQGPNVAKVTIPEGFSSGQIAQRLGKNGFDAQKIYTKLQGVEGKLFPDTYYFLKNETPDEIIKDLTDEYQKKTTELSLSEDDLILASIVEREAKKDVERPQIAAVYKNRLEQGKDLEADPTVQYARDLDLIKSQGLTGTNLWEPLGAGQTKSISSAYNTYVNGGLPPGPICNPGLKSIKAALTPEIDFDYLYFFHDKDGVIHFSKSFEEHKELIKQFGL